MIRPEADPTTVVAARWASRVTAIGLEFALPPLLGGYLDGHWRTGRLLTTIGAGFGFVAGMIHILAIAREIPSPSKSRRPAGGDGLGADGSNGSGQRDHG